MASTKTPYPIRLAEPRDATVISALVERAYTPWVEVVGLRPRPMDDDFTARIAAGQAWVLEIDGNVAGAIVIEDMPEHVFLHNVAVDPTRQGKGIGRQLLQFVEDEAKRRGFSQVELTTLEGMESNVALYKRLGYVVTGRVNRGKFDRLTMTKNIG